MTSSNVIRIASWNINSIRIRANIISDFISQHNIDILCLQETKVVNSLFPIDTYKDLGFSHIEYDGNKSYAGVATLSRIPISLLNTRKYCNNGQKRHLSVNIDGTDIELHNFYMPAGGDIPDPEENPSFAYKLEFYDEIIEEFRSYQDKSLVVLGDFNIAPLEQDVWSHKQLLNVVSHTPIEVEKFNTFMKSCDFIDTYRYLHGTDDKAYTWWSYRARDWKKSNRGRRLDHILISRNLQDNLKDCMIYDSYRGFEKPSDHVPIVVELSI